LLANGPDLRVKAIQLQDHFLNEVGHAEGGLAKMVNESTQCLVSFLYDAKDG